MTFATPATFIEILTGSYTVICNQFGNVSVNFAHEEHCPNDELDSNDKTQRRIVRCLGECEGFLAQLGMAERILSKESFKVVDQAVEPMQHRVLTMMEKLDNMLVIRLQKLLQRVDELGKENENLRYQNYVDEITEEVAHQRHELQHENLVTRLRYLVQRMNEVGFEVHVDGNVVGDEYLAVDTGGTTIEIVQEGGRLHRYVSGEMYNSVNVRIALLEGVMDARDWPEKSNDN